MDLSGQFHFFSGCWSAKKTVTWRISAHNGVRVLNLGCKQLALEPDLCAHIRWPKKQYVKPRGYKIFLSSRFSTSLTLVSINIHANYRHDARIHTRRACWFQQANQCGEHQGENGNCNWRYVVYWNFLLNMEHLLIRRQVPTVWEKPMFGLWLLQGMRRC